MIILGLSLKKKKVNEEWARLLELHTVGLIGKMSDGDIGPLKPIARGMNYPQSF